MHILKEKFGSSCRNVEFIFFFFFFWRMSRALCLPPREQQLCVFHHPSLSPPSSEGSKIEWGRSSVCYTNVYELCLLLTSCFSSLLPSPSWQKPKARLLPEPGTVSPRVQWCCGQEWWGLGLCPSAQGWAGWLGQWRIGQREEKLHKPQVGCSAPALSMVSQGQCGFLSKYLSAEV